MPSRNIITKKEKEIEIVRNDQLINVYTVAVISREERRVKIMKIKTKVSKLKETQIAQDQYGKIRQWKKKNIEYK